MLARPIHPFNRCNEQTAQGGGEARQPGSTGVAQLLREKRCMRWLERRTMLDTLTAAFSDGNEPPTKRSIAFATGAYDDYSASMAMFLVVVHQSRPSPSAWAAEDLFVSRSRYYIRI
ncbi:hypothetical protein SPI_03179 [Niveomyces insectorum RCEF 264]|uniref:Uncharacterized protein n=1 Tax=Niveomyces insectorum RCEF 264 TaxID=1081102 RepID=A0A162J6Q1_9HYPO|nr:hypothetical protein SPI_03179 [Niveomyces insectorum RCEF 264]